MLFRDYGCFYVGEIETFLCFVLMDVPAGGIDVIMFTWSLVDIVVVLLSMCSICCIIRWFIHRSSDL